MNHFLEMLWVEALKARRSRLPWITALGFLLAPAAIGLLMYVVMHPEFAREIGLLRAKADLSIGAADWPTFFGILAQAIAVGGLLLFSLAQSWIFGREYADGTLKDLLATPTPRAAVLAAKFAVWMVWCLGMTAVVLLGGAIVGALLRLPGGSAGVFGRGAWQMAWVAALTCAALTPIGLFASIGRGYLLPMGAAFAFLSTAQVAAVLGWGLYFPWSIPALAAGFQVGMSPTTTSYLIIALTGLAGVLGVTWWWKNADHHN